MIPFDRLIQPIWDVSPYSIAVVSYDPEPKNRKFFFVNSAFAKLTGYVKGELVGNPATLLNGPETSKPTLEDCEVALTRGETYESAIVRYRKDGSKFVSRATVARLVEPDGSAQYLIMIEMPLDVPESGSIEELHGNIAAVPLTLPMPFKEFPYSQPPKHLTSHPQLEIAQELWVKLRGDRDLPRRVDFDLNTMKEWASRMSVATVTPNGRYQFRLFGTELSNVYGRDLTGSFLDELTPMDLWSVIIMHYKEVVQSRQPLFAPISIANGRWYSEVSRLLLPLGSDSDKVAYVMGIDYPRAN